MREKNPIGKVVETLGGGRFRVQMIDSGELVICYLGGKLKIRKISISLGDKVEIVLDPAGGDATNRIVWRV